ncbi:MAG: OmpA family protein [Bacteroidota bacterium]
MKMLKLLMLLLILSTAVHAQFVTDNKKVADVYFQNNEFYAAAEYYKKALQISSDSSGFIVPYGFEKKLTEENPKREDYEYCVFQLAESLRGYKNFTDAERWYTIAKEFKNPKYILSSFWYAETLRANQKFNEAISAFNVFLAKYPVKDNYAQKAKVEISSCQFALYELRYPRMFQLDKLQNSINRKGSNYTPALKDGKFYFTSSRPVNTSGKTEILSDDENTNRVEKKETPFLNAVYEVDGSPLQKTITIRKAPARGKGKESAAPAFHPNGKVLYITSWTTRGDKKIFQQTAGDDDNDWSDPLELGSQVNAKGFNSQQPYVSQDGKYLIFSSDRPGGSGKFDLWYCTLRPDGSLGQAMNMGTSINTADDDEAPYYNHKTGTLIYSSNGRVGLGGFDFFESKGDFTKWDEPRNLGYPFNSSKDDIYFTPNNGSDSEGYISSDRESLCCLEVFYVKKEFLSVRGTLLDCATLKPIKNATVTLADSLEKIHITTDESGKYNFKISTNRKLKLSAGKEKYFTKVLNLNYDDLAKSDTLYSAEICLAAFEVDKPIVLKDIFYEFDKADLTANSKVKLDHLYGIMIDNPSLEIELSAHTDSKGPEIYNQDLSERRARSCVEYLISKGIPEARMVSKGYGETMPVASNTLKNGKDNPSGRAVNRRTEFKVTKK